MWDLNEIDFLNFPDISWLSSTFALIGKFFAAAGYALVYQYTGELFPTSVRSTAIGAASMFARFGSVLSPYVASLVSNSPQ